MEGPAAAVLHLRPVDFAPLAVVAVILGPLLGLGDCVDLAALVVYQRNVRMYEAVPVPVELLDGAHHGPVHFGVVAPAGCRQGVEHGVELGINQGGGAQAGVLAVLGLLADNIGRNDGRGVHGVVGAANTFRGAVFEKLHDDGRLCVVVAQGVVHALGHVRDREGVQNNVGAFKLCPVVLKGQRLSAFFGVSMDGGIEYIHDVDRPHVSLGVIEVLREHFAEGEVLPVGRVAELGLDFAHVLNFQRHVDKILVRIVPDQVHRSRADINGHSVGLLRRVDFAVEDLAVCAM